MIYVVGSGPAGVACAHAFASRGAPITMLDAGVELEPERGRILTMLRAQQPPEWNAAAIQRIKQPVDADRRAIPLKAAYGSLFPYQHAAQSLSVERRGIDASPSYALGGFSNVWGATVLPYDARDIVDWPIGVTELRPHYEQTARLMEVSERTDRLAAGFPLFTDGSQFLKPSRQTEAFMRDLESSAEPLEAAGWRFGYSRLAVVANRPDGGQGCVYCGLCLSGCPYGLIYNAASTLDRLRRFDNFSYRSDVIVTRVVESAGRVRIHAEHRQTGEPLLFDGDRVCLAAGPFSTTAILLASLEAYGTPVDMLDSQLFALPLLRYRGVARVAAEPLHTLAQVFMELRDPMLAARTIHLQVYSYNDWYRDAIKTRLGALYPLAKPWLNALLGRLMVVQGYLPSDVSPRIHVTLTGGEGRATLVLEAGEDAGARSAIHKIVDRLRDGRRHLRAMALRPLLEVGAPGRGYHTGGSFPMRERPSRFESDEWGRPNGFERVHAVDATVFPSIPAGPITFTVMANAHRIASELISRL